MRLGFIRLAPKKANIPSYQIVGQVISAPLIETLKL